MTRRSLERKAAREVDVTGVLTRNVDRASPEQTCSDQGINWRSNELPTSDAARVRSSREPHESLFHSPHPHDESRPSWDRS